MTSAALPPPAATALDLHRLLRNAIVSGERTLHLPAGDHHVEGTSLPEDLLWISNNDPGVKPILLDFQGAENLTVEGNGCRILVTGVLIPLLVRNAKNVTIRNLTIDWVRPAFTEVEVLRSGEGFFEIDSHGQLATEAGRLVAVGGGDWPRAHLYNALSFDAARREPLGRSGENWSLERYHRATARPDGTIRVEADLGWIPPAGIPLVTMHGDRVAPAVVIDASEGITLEDVTIHHALGMGVIAQISRDVTLRRVQVVPAPGRLFSTWVDATHFVDCAGSIRLLDCTFRGMFDDGTNIHGAHRKIVEWLGPDRFVVQAMHHQQLGIPYHRAGDLCEFADLETLASLGEARVAEVRILNSRLQEVRLENPVTGLEGKTLAIRKNDPDLMVEISGCTIGNNRGRGMLLSVPGRIDVRGNTVHSSGNAIETPPDAAYWWESGPVQHLEISENLFDACGYAMCGTQVLVVTAPSGPPDLHGKVIFRDNDVRLAGATFLTARRVRDLDVRDNTISRSSDYPWLAGAAAELEAISNLHIDPVPEL